MARLILRRWLAGVNWGVTLAALFVLLILVNYVASRRYVRHDLSRVRITQLSDKTAQVLQHLQAPVRVVVFFQPTQRLYELLRDLLKSYEDRSPQVAVEYVDPEQDRARVLQLAKEFELERANVVIVSSGSRKKFLSEADLAEYDYNSMGFGGQPSLKAFKGEEAFTSAIISVTQTAQARVWVTSGHGEKSIDDSDVEGLADLKRHLERENATVATAALLEQPEIPAEVNLIVIPGPERRFIEQEVLALESYLERGGRIFALIDPLTNTGLDGLLAKWGVELGHDIVVDPARPLPFVSPANLLVTTYTQHPIVERMETLITLFPLSRSVQPSASHEGLQTSILAMTSPEGWGETTTGSEVFKFDDGQDAKGPVSIAVAVERRGEMPTRLVVIGDSDFLANSQLGNVGNLDLASGAIQWLLNQEQLIGIGPKPLESIKLRLSAAQLQGVWLFNVLALPGLFVGLGIAMWWFRRQ